jgi:histidine phosphotransfer protein HptB
MIDWARLKDLRSEIGEDDFLEVVEMFLEETDEVVAHLDGPPDLATVESRLHFLKGSALNLGLTDLAALCQRGEKSATLGNAAMVSLQEVTASYKSSKAQLLAELGRPEAA